MSSKRGSIVVLYLSVFWDHAYMTKPGHLCVKQVLYGGDMYRDL